MTDDEKWWREVRDCALAIAADRLRRGVLSVREIGDAIDEAGRQGYARGYLDAENGYDWAPEFPP